MWLATSDQSALVQRSNTTLNFLWYCPGQLISIVLNDILFQDLWKSYNHWIMKINSRGKASDSGFRSTTRERITTMTSTTLPTRGSWSSSGTSTTTNPSLKSQTSKPSSARTHESARPWNDSGPRTPIKVATARSGTSSIGAQIAGASSRSRRTGRSPSRGSSIVRRRPRTRSRSWPLMTVIHRRQPLPLWPSLSRYKATLRLGGKATYT